MGKPRARARGHAPEKGVRFVGSSRDDLMNFPKAVRQEVGFDLRRVQQGLRPRDGKFLRNVGRGVMEIRVRLQGNWRVVYVAKFENTVHVLHAFEKKTQKTSRRDLAVVAARYKEISP